MADWLSGWIDWFINLSTTWPLWGKVLVVFGVLAGLAGGIGALISFWDWTIGGAIKREKARKAKAREAAAQAKRDEDLRETREAAEATKSDAAETRRMAEDTNAKLAQVLAALDAQRPAGAAPPDPAERERRDAAVADIVADPAPAAQSAARAIAAGDIPAAVATLERDARADVANAAEKYRRLGALVREFDTAKARAAYEAAFALQPADFWTCIELSRLRRTAGDTSGARAAAEAAGRAAGTDREWSVALNDLGNVLVAQGNLPEAQKTYRDGLAIADRLAKSDPGNAGWQRDLSVSYEKVGDVLVAQGDGPGALASYRDSLTIRDRLAKSDPGNAEWQRDLLVSHEKLANAGDDPRSQYLEIVRILRELQSTGRLAPADKEWPAEAEAELAKLSK